MTSTVAVFAASLLLALAFTPLAMRAATSLGIVDRPDRKLKRHARTVPYLGGAAIFAATASCVVVVKLLVDGTPRGVVGMLAGATMVFLLGLWDDIRPLKPKTKLLFQVLAAAVPVYFSVHLKFIDNRMVAIPLTILWIVGVTNAFNLLDIMDGLAGGVALTACLWFWLISALNGRYNDALTAAALAGACLGFLRYNRPPARVFMGDAGALFIGFSMACVAIGQGYSMNSNIGVMAPVLILGIPLFETFFVMAIRRQQGKPMMVGSPDHVPLRLVKMGYSRSAAVLMLCVAGAILGALAFLVTRVNWERALLVSCAAGIAAFLAAIRLAQVDMKE